MSRKTGCALSGILDVAWIEVFNVTPLRKVGLSMAQVRSKTRIGGENIEKILDAGLVVFSRFGLHGARIDQIADAAGMSKPNLLYYFRTKSDLYIAVLTRTLDMWLDPLREINADADPHDALANYMARKIAYSRSHPEASRLFAIEIIQGAPMLQATLKNELAPLVAAKVAILKRWIAEGKLEAIEPLHLLFQIWATTQHYADFASQIEALTGRTLDDPAFFASAQTNILKTILTGVLPKGA
jgi:TetR/AcrR family transcriptional regulator